jgi:short-subunit dehydrogenase
LENLERLPTPQAFFHCSVLFDESIELILRVNVSQPIHLLNHVIARMKQQNNGKIGVLLGQNGRLGLPGLGNFSATQGALWTWFLSA